MNSAAGLLGMFGGRGKSERDLMWEQAKVGEWVRQKNLLGLQQSPGHVRLGLLKAGVNPMLPYANGGSGPVGAPGAMPSIAAPYNRMEPVMRGLQAGVSSALEVARTLADIDKKKAETKTEAERPAAVRAETEERIASTLNKRQQARLSVLDQQLRTHDIDVRAREAVIARIQAGLWNEADAVIVQALRKLKISESVVPKVLGTIDRLRELDEKLQEGASGAVSSALQWWRENFDSSREEKKKWPN